MAPPFNGHEFEQALGDSEGQGSRACCSPWDCKESDTTELNNNDMVRYSHTQDQRDKAQMWYNLRGVSVLVWTLSQMLISHNWIYSTGKRDQGRKKAGKPPGWPGDKWKLWVLPATKTVSQWLEGGNGFPTSCEFENPICDATLSCYFRNPFIFFRDISGALPSSWKAVSFLQKSLHQQELRHFSCNCIILEMWFKKYSLLGEEGNIAEQCSAMFL